jgi:hypothetical protein
MRLTIHLEPIEREWLTRLTEQRTLAAAQLARAERDFDLAATTTAAARGLKPVSIGALTDVGLVITLPVAMAPIEPAPERPE